jgi:hypothetical protein
MYIHCTMEVRVTSGGVSIINAKVRKRIAKESPWEGEECQECQDTRERTSNRPLHRRSRGSVPLGKTFGL